MGTLWPTGGVSFETLLFLIVRSSSSSSTSERLLLVALSGWGLRGVLAFPLICGMEGIGA